jgi:hypothetical protein
MKTLISVTSTLSLCVGIHAAFAQNVPSPGTAAGISTVCDQFKLSFQDLADCRTQWGAATNDGERLRIQNAFSARAGVRGSSTPPVRLNSGQLNTNTVVPGAGLNTGNVSGAVGATPSSPAGPAPTSPGGITPTSPAGPTPQPLSSTVAPTPSAVAPLTPASPAPSTAIPPAPSPAIRTPPPSAGSGGATPGAAP